MGLRENGKHITDAGTAQEYMVTLPEDKFQNVKAKMVGDSRRGGVRIGS